MKTIELLIEAYRREQAAGYYGGGYRKTQVDFAFNSNRIEGSQLSKEHTRQLFETRSILSEKEEVIFSDDIICANNHFRAFKYILDYYQEPLTEDFIKRLHGILLQGTKVEGAGVSCGGVQDDHELCGRSGDGSGEGGGFSDESALGRVRSG